MVASSGSKIRKNRIGQGDDPVQADIVKLDLAFNRLVSISAVGAAIGFGSVKLAAFPRGDFLYLPSVLFIEFAEDPKSASIDENWSGDYSLGTTATPDLTLSGTEVDLLASTALDVASSGNFARARKLLATALANTVIDNSDGSKSVNLNLIVDAGNIADGSTPTIRVKGNLHMAFIPYGKNTAG